MVDFGIDIFHTDDNARTGVIRTAHGEIRTPAFMPVGTCATVKAMLPESVKNTGTDIILGNTYHLMLRDQAEIIYKHGGLHNFMNWHAPILTDSGGFQVMSLSKLRKITEDGVCFRAHTDGMQYMLTPERAIEIQYLLGSDITMVLDECTPVGWDYKRVRKSMELTLKWAQRCRNAFIDRAGYAIFGILQGSIFKDLRSECMNRLIDIGFDGYAVGGCVGSGEEMTKVLDWICPILPFDKPRYVMGIGEPKDIIGSVIAGFDMFDCILPTRSGRHGFAYTKHGKIKIRHARYREDNSALDDDCQCITCKNYTVSYLNHLFRSNEILGCMLLTWHNIQFYQNMMQNIRESIVRGDLQKFSQEFLGRFYHTEK